MRFRRFFAAALLAGLAGSYTISAQTKTQWDGIYTEAQATRGRALYQEKCAYCHGKTLAGFVDPDNPAPSLAGDAFAANWNNRTLSEIYDKISMTMPQDQPGALSPAETADVISFLLSSGKYPAGTTDLPAKSDDLKAFKFTAKQ